MRSKTTGMSFETRIFCLFLRSIDIPQIDLIDGSKKFHSFSNFFVYQYFFIMDSPYQELSIYVTFINFEPIVFS